MGYQVALVNSQPDCAGVAWHLKQALQEVTGWDVRSIAGGRNYLDYPQDLLFDEDAATIRGLEPDLWILQNGLVDVCARLGFEPAKAIVLHHGNDIRYGTKPNYDKSHRLYSQEHGWPVYVTTLDLEWLVPDVSWLPPAVDLAALAKYRDPQERFIVSHSPTSRDQKGTRMVLEGIRMAREMGLDFDFDLIEGVPNTECLARKGRSSLFIDQVRWGYGVNALEAMAMGVPVVTGFIHPGIGDYTEARLEPFRPFRRADTALEIAEAIREAIAAPRGSEGLEYVRTYHSYEAAGRNLGAVCLSAF